MGTFTMILIVAIIAASIIKYIANDIVASEKNYQRSCYEYDMIYRIDTLMRARETRLNPLGILYHKTGKSKKAPAPAMAKK